MSIGPPYRLEMMDKMKEKWYVLYDLEIDKINQIPPPEKENNIFFESFSAVIKTRTEDRKPDCFNSMESKLYCFVT